MINEHPLFAIKDGETISLYQGSITDALAELNTAIIDGRKPTWYDYTQWCQNHHPVASSGIEPDLAGAITARIEAECIPVIRWDPSHGGWQ